jgi:pyruvate dehydrogenase E2 component (dihydrolipoamide acetyltransferase)
VITDVVVPQGGLEVSEATVLGFRVAVGDSVSEGDPLVEVETDKAMTEIVAPADGVVLSVHVEEGQTVEVGALVIRLGEPGAAPEAAEPAAQPSPAAPVAAAAAPGRPAPAPAAHADERRGAHRIRAAPLARRAAEKLGVSLAEVEGTGPRGRITLRDVERAAGAHPRPAAAAPAADGGERLEPLSATRRAIARRMIASQAIPQFALQREVDVAWLLGEKDRITAEGPAKVGVNDLLLQALAETVVRHPDLGASFTEGEGGEPALRRRDGVDAGLAVATDRGLLVPVIRSAHARTLAEISIERARLTSEARAGRLGREDMTGATISLSSLASFGVDRFNAMLNPGESAILAVGRTVDRLVPRDGGIALAPTMTLTLTLDHRVVDGARGGRALAELVELLEGGMAWRA